MVEHVDEGRFITENVLVHDPSWPGPLVLVVFVAFNTSQLIAKCLGRNGMGDVIEHFLVFRKSHCILPVRLMQDSEGGEILGRRVLVTGLSEREYMSRTAPGPVLPFPHSPLPFPLKFPHRLDPFAYNPLYCADEDTIVTSCFPLSRFFSFIQSYL